MSSGISSRRIASICHCGEPYHTESVPQSDVVGAHAVDERADERGAEARMRHRRVGERGAELGVDVVDAVLLRDLGEVGGPADAAGLLELAQRLVGSSKERPQRAW